MFFTGIKLFFLFYPGGTDNEASHWGEKSSIIRLRYYDLLKFDFGETMATHSNRIKKQVSPLIKTLGLKWKIFFSFAIKGITLFQLSSKLNLFVQMFKSFTILFRDLFIFPKRLSRFCMFQVLNLFKGTKANKSFLLLSKHVKMSVFLWKPLVNGGSSGSGISSVAL